jgi:hypothetical protein
MVQFIRDVCEFHVIWRESLEPPQDPLALRSGPTMPLGAPTQVQERDDSGEHGGPDRDEGAEEGQAIT